ATALFFSAYSGGYNIYTGVKSASSATAAPIISGRGQIYELFAAGTRLYWTEYATSQHRLFTALQNGTGVTELDANVGSGNYIDFATDGQYVYWNQYSGSAKIRRVLMIGLGGGTAARQFARFYPDAVVDIVEVDPLVVDVAKRYFGVTPAERLRIHIADGRTFLARSREQWDLIIIDAYTVNRYGDTIPAHLTTREFFTTVAARLGDGGIVHFHCAFADSKLSAAIHTTMASVFPSVLRTGGEFLASSVPLLADPHVLLERAKASPAAHFPALAPSVASLRRDPPPRGAIRLTDDYAPVDTLLGRH
ncbi:MAG: spermidine synthase, partial [Thermoanaerobaculia bacterium]